MASGLECRLEARRVERTTPLSAAPGFFIAAGLNGRAAARRLAGCLERHQRTIRILEDPPLAALEEAGSGLLIGNLADSRAVRDLYYRFLLVTDRGYPGPGGYEIRTLLDPFGRGHNFVHLGYSDRAGLEAGFALLTERLADPLPYFSEVKFSRLPVPDAAAERLRRTPLPADPRFIVHDEFGDLKGYLGYLSGEPGLLADFHRVLAATIEAGRIGHLYAYSRLVVWRLLEYQGLIPEELRQPFLETVYQWAEGHEGIGRLLENPGYTSPHLPRQNHGLMPALALLYAADYFQVHHPGLAGPAWWRQAAETLFQPYASSWKHHEDCVIHGFRLSQPMLLGRGLLDPAHRYFEAGGAARAAECAMVLVNNRGLTPNFGDSDLIRSFPGPSLRAAAAYYRDGRYAYVNDLAADGQRRDGLELPVFQAFEAGVESKEPERPAGGLTVIPLDPLIYRVWEREPELAVGFTAAPPAAPIDECFDKLCIRTGWRENDDYLLVDGLGGALHIFDRKIDCTHAYDDAAAVLEYSRFGLAGLVSEDSLVLTDPEDHTAVTVTRDGRRGPVPAYAALKEKEIFPDGRVRLLLRLAAYAGADWDREIIFCPGRAVFFRDKITARAGGDYVAEVHFRTPAKAVLEGNRLLSRRESAGAGPVDLRIISRSSPDSLRLAARPVELILGVVDRVKDPAGRSVNEKVLSWCRRYRTPEPALTQLTGRRAGYLGPGESFCFEHLVQIRGAGEPELELVEKSGRLLMAAPGWEADLGESEPARPVSVSAAPAVPARLPAARPFAEVEGRITCLRAAADDGPVCGTDTGGLTRFDAAGRRQWERRLAGPIRDIAILDGPAGAGLIGVGHAADRLSLLDGRGEPLWERRIERVPTHWPWFELETPLVARLIGADFGAGPLLVAGCGDSRLRAFDTSGNERWQFLFLAGVPGRLAAADFDGDGRVEIAAGGEITNMASTCRLLDRDGLLKAELLAEGWTSLLKSLAWGEVDGRPLICLGANHGRNLRVYGLEAMKSGGRPRLIWEELLGGAVLQLRLDPQRPLLWIGTAAGFLIGAEPLTGRFCFTRLLDGAVTGLATRPGGVLVQTAAGSAWLVNAAGEVTARLEPEAARENFLPDGDGGLFFTVGNRLFRLPAETGPSAGGGGKHE